MTAVTGPVLHVSMMLTALETDIVHRYPVSQDLEEIEDNLLSTNEMQLSVIMEDGDHDIFLTFTHNNSCYTVL